MGKQSVCLAELYAELVDESSNSIYVSDTDNYDLLYVNRTCLKALGRGQDDYKGKKCYEFMFGGTSPCEFCKIKQMNYDSFLERTVNYVPTDRIYTTRGKLLTWNGSNAHVEYIQDVTELKNMEKQLLEEKQSRERQYQEELAHGQNVNKLKDDVLQAVVSLEYDYISYANLKEDTFKLYAGELMGLDTHGVHESQYSLAEEKRVRAVVVPEDLERVVWEMSPAGMRANLEKEEIFTTVFSMNDGVQGIRQKRIQYAYFDENKEKIIVTRTDVTDLLDKQTKQQSALESALLAAKQANSAKSDFLSRMSHEIRTPMNAIIGMSAIAAQSMGNDRQVADCIGKIGISARFLLSLINDILDMSRIESGKLLLKNEIIPLEELLHEINSICGSQAQAQNIEYENITDASLEDYYIGDVMKLKQVLINIIGNAIKFTPEGGKVVFYVQQASKDSHNAKLRFVINDTGCGIKQEFMPRLFEPFAQENMGNTAMYSGTGLGLAICKNLVDLMGGDIHVRSVVGFGSEFTVEIPLGITEESKKRYLSKNYSDFKALKTLVVDDDITVCEQAMITLKEIGVTAQWVDSGRKAVDLVQQKWTEQQSFDLILLDWKMPDMDGIATARRIRSIVGPEVTIIIMTAYDWSNIEAEARKAGVNLFMSKPMFKSSLIFAFEQALGKQVEEKTVVTEEFRFEGKRILLAEDHPLNVEVAKKLLESRGFTVDVAENGLRALEMFTTTAVGYYDAILMDIRMPEMDGLQASYSIRRWRKDDAKTIPIVAMTANAFDDDVHKSKAAGMNAHLAKPVEPQQLYQLLYDLIYGAKDALEQNT